MKAVGIILAGGNNERLGELARKRAVAAMPLAGMYRGIDFALSNMSNSGISTVAVLAQYSSRSLSQHLSSSKWWNFGRKQGGLFLLNPTITPDNNTWYRGTGDALIQNLDFIKERHEPYIIIASGDGVYKLDLNAVLDAHIASGADMTVVCHPLAESADTGRFGVLEVAENGRISGWAEKQKDAAGRFINCGIYVIRRRRLITYLEGCRLKEEHDLVKGILLPLAASGKLNAFVHEGYWNNINSVQGYFDTNMAMLDPALRREFFLEYPTIHTRVDDFPPAKVNPGAVVHGSLVGSGCIVNGRVESSVLFKKAYVGSGSSLKNCILLDDAYIGEDVTLENCIVEEKVKIENGFTLKAKRNAVTILEGHAE